VLVWLWLCLGISHSHSHVTRPPFTGTWAHRGWRPLHCIQQAIPPPGSSASSHPTASATTSLQCLPVQVRSCTYRALPCLTFSSLASLVSHAPGRPLATKQGTLRRHLTYVTGLCACQLQPPRSWYIALASRTLGTRNRASYVRTYIHRGPGHPRHTRLTTWTCSCGYCLTWDAPSYITPPPSELARRCPIPLYLPS